MEKPLSIRRDMYFLWDWGSGHLQISIPHHVLLLAAEATFYLAGIFPLVILAAGYPSFPTWQPCSPLEFRKFPLE